MNEIEAILNSTKNVKSKKLDGICLSENPPSNNNVLWILYDKQNNFTINIYWCNHWHPIYSNLLIDEVIKKLKLLFTSNMSTIDARILLILSEKLLDINIELDYDKLDLTYLVNLTLDRLNLKQIAFTGSYKDIEDMNIITPDFVLDLLELILTFEGEIEIPDIIYNWDNIIPISENLISLLLGRLLIL